MAVPDGAAISLPAPELPWSKCRYSTAHSKRSNTAEHVRRQADRGFRHPAEHIAKQFHWRAKFLSRHVDEWFANSLDQQLTSFINPSNGAFTVDLQSINSQISDLENSIDNFETNYITPLKAQLQSEYSQAEILLQQLPRQIEQINTELGYNNTQS